MRITSETMVMRSLDRLQTRMGAYERSQSELSTGKRILQPSDDPAGTRRAMSLRSSLGAREQELSNASDATGWLNNADSQLQAVVSRLSRVRELTTRGASNAGEGERRALAAEVREITAEIEGIANTRHAGRSLFGGFTDGAAVERTDAAGAPDPNGDTWTTRGDGDEVRRRVSDAERVRVNVTASEWMGTGGDNVLARLERLADDLETGSSAEVSAQLDSLDVANGLVTDSLAQIGAAMNRVDSARARAEDLSLTARTELSDVEDVDVAKAVMELQVQEVGYESTLQALGRALPPSLGAFLR